MAHGKEEPNTASVILLEDGEAMEAATNNKGSAYSRQFNPRDQTWKLLRQQAPRLAITIVRVCFVITTLKIYQNEGNIGDHNKTAFNVIITVLSLALGLNFLEAFRDMARVLRWRVLANRAFSVREADLILSGESLMKLITLMFEAKRPIIMCVCTAWVALNLLAQASIAMIGLTYSVDGGTDSTGIITQPGTVLASALDCYYDNSVCANNPDQAPEVSQNLAHSFGSIIRGQLGCPYDSDTDILDASQACYYFYKKKGTEHAFRYSEDSPNDTSRSYPFLTDRIIKASPGQCFQYSIDSDKAYSIDSNDGAKEIVVESYSNGTFNGTIPVPKPNLANDATTYIYPGQQPPQNEIDYACGDRCLRLYALRLYGKLSNRPQTLFECAISVSTVSQTIADSQMLPDDNAHLAAASIALSGRYTNPNGSVEKAWEQYQLYPWGSYWETEGLSADLVGARMSEFAIGAIAVMANLNPTISIAGTLPSLGYHLSIKWKYVIALTACIAGVHTLLVVLILWIARPIIIGGESTLATARLLGGLVGRLGGEGCLLDGRDIAEMIQEKETGEKIGAASGGVVYGVRKTEEGRMVVELGGEIEVRKRLNGGRFPRGTYM